MITCQLYDSIELLCMKHFCVSVYLLNGRCITGIALDTARNSQRIECLKISLPDDNTELIVLTDISLIKVNTKNTYMSEVRFT
ncbi:Rho-binding antiterminator [Pseudoalteromonas sp. MMG010]|uniref:Rho-binding antiterminator n=1 Tax=Pseudoalteromonas sp. MMG010 TaxID=2822685 RepID=UPI001B3A72E1|nr:Rho-binding antiterminator [Pseudoalteromonas sp. MMG010]MBQ4833788.1 Rho-binding antiterminator [Pseudoalteromonas sp. MMG010]